MEIKKETFQIKIFGKCKTKTDIMQLFNFGYSKENIVKKYAKDNKIKEIDARRRVEEILWEELCKK